MFIHQIGGGEDTQSCRNSTSKRTMGCCRLNPSQAPKGAGHTAHMHLEVLEKLQNRWEHTDVYMSIQSEAPKLCLSAHGRQQINHAAVGSRKRPKNKMLIFATTALSKAWHTATGWLVPPLSTPMWSDSMYGSASSDDMSCNRECFL